MRKAKDLILSPPFNERARGILAGRESVLKRAVNQLTFVAVYAAVHDLVGTAYSTCKQIAVGQSDCCGAKLSSMARVCRFVE